MAIHINDVVLLLSSSCLIKLCENFTTKIISITPLHFIMKMRCKGIDFFKINLYIDKYFHFYQRTKNLIQRNNLRKQRKKILNQRKNKLRYYFTNIGVCLCIISFLKNGVF